MQLINCTCMLSTCYGGVGLQDGTIQEHHYFQSFGTTIISGEQVWIADHDGLVQQIASQQYCTIMYPLQMELVSG